MTFPLFWAPEAQADLEATYAWYAGKGALLAERFALAVEGTVNAIARNPLQFPVVHRGRRRAGVRRFPYGIIYEVQERRIVVMACFHGRRDPKRWQSR